MSRVLRCLRTDSALRVAAGKGLVLGLAVMLAGCSGGVSRFDYPMFAKKSSDDILTTGALSPIPSQPIYKNGATANIPAVVKQDLPPPKSQLAYTAPRRQYQPQPQYQPPQQPYSAPRVLAPVAPANKIITVQNGDTLYNLANRHGVTIDELKSANDLKGTRLGLGQKLTIPGQARVQTAVRMASNGPAMASLPLRRPAGARQSAPLPAKSAVSTARGGNKVASRGKSLPQPEAMTGNQFRWPVKGRIISGFGVKSSGKHNDGINVAVPKGTSVKAAENGVVAYAGSELEPYGNLVLIRHANNWVTAYAHNDILMVKRGDTVGRGQVIAKAGQTGNVSQPQLHFELRKGSKPINPLPYMASN